MAKTLSQKPQFTPSEARLNERVATLEQAVQSLQTHPSSSSFRSFSRHVLIALLILLSVLSLNLAITSIWLKRSVIQTDSWTARSTELLQNQSVRTDIATKITDEIFTSTDIERVVTDAVPPRLANVTPALVASLRQQTINKTSEILASDQFQTFWKNATASAHSGIVASLENGGAAPENTDQYIIYIDDDQLLLNLKPIVQNAQAKLADAGLGFVSNINTAAIDRTVTLTQIQSLPKILAVFNLIDKSAPLFGLIAILCGAGALALSRSRQKTVIALGVTIIAVMIINVQGLTIAQYPFIQQFASLDAVSTSTATAVYTLFVEGLIGLSRLVIVLAVIVLVVAFLCGPSALARTTRDFINRVSGPKKSSGFLSFIAKYKTVIVSTVAAVSALLVVFPPITGQVFPVVLVAIASLLSLWVYSLHAPPRTEAP